MAHPKRPRVQKQAFNADRHANDDVTLANLAEQGGNRAGNRVDEAIHDKTSRAFAPKRGTKRKKIERREANDPDRSPNTLDNTLLKFF
jgi:hypothetical protein